MIDKNSENENVEIIAVAKIFPIKAEPPKSTLTKNPFNKDINNTDDTTGTIFGLKSKKFSTLNHLLREC